LRVRYAAAVCIPAVVLASCGGAIGPPVVRGGPAAAPAAIREDLLYIVDRGARAVDIYSFPQLQRTGRLRGLSPTGDCADGDGNVWITSVAGSIVEFPHGGSRRLKTLHLTSGEAAKSCAVDPKTGNLAVTSDGPVYVFVHARGPHREYRARWSSGDYCTYDNAGNLYVAGTVGEERKFVAAAWALNRQEHGLRRLDFHGRVHFAYSGGMQWDGHDVAWGDLQGIASHTAVIYQIDPRKRRDKFVGNTPLILRGDLGQFFIRGHTAFVPYFIAPRGGAVAIFNYPSGGDRLATITGFRQPVAVTFSAAASRR
jgi:hypothetical protein